MLPMTRASNEQAGRLLYVRDHAVIHFKWQPSRRDLRVFALGLALLTGILAQGLLRRGGSSAGPIALACVSILLGLVGAVRPTLVRPIYLVWMLVMFPIGWCVSHVLLAGVFWLLITPLGLVWKFLGIDPLHRRFDQHCESYWSERPPSPPAARYFRQF